MLAATLASCGMPARPRPYMPSVPLATADPLSPVVSLYTALFAPPGEGKEKPPPNPT